MNTTENNALKEKTSHSSLSNHMRKAEYTQKADGTLHIHIPARSQVLPYIILFTVAPMFTAVFYMELVEKGMSAGLAFGFAFLSLAVFMLIRMLRKDKKRAETGEDDIILHPGEKSIFFGKQLNLDTAIPFKDIAAIQLLENTYKKTRGSGENRQIIYVTASEANLVFHDGKRKNIIDSTQKGLVMKIANDFAPQIDVPIWDEIGPSSLEAFLS